MDQPPSQFIITRRWGRSRPHPLWWESAATAPRPAAGVVDAAPWPTRPRPRPRLPFCSAEVGPEPEYTSQQPQVSGAWAKALGLSQLLSCNTSAFFPLIIFPVEERNINMCMCVCIYLPRLCVIFPYSDGLLASFSSSSTASKIIKYCYL